MQEVNALLLPHSLTLNSLLDYIFVIGGQLGGLPDFWARFTLTVEYFDIKRGAWNVLSQMVRQAHPGSSPVLLGDTIIIAGGESNNVSYAETSLIDAAKLRVLDEEPLLNQGRHAMGVAVCQDEVYVLSGSSSRPDGVGKINALLKSVEVLSIHKNLQCGSSSSVGSYWEF